MHIYWKISRWINSSGKLWLNHIFDFLWFEEMQLWKTWIFWTDINVNIKTNIFQICKTFRDLKVLHWWWLIPKKLFWQKSSLNQLYKRGNSKEIKTFYMLSKIVAYFLANKPRKAELSGYSRRKFYCSVNNFYMI